MHYAVSLGFQPGQLAAISLRFLLRQLPQPIFDCGFEAAIQISGHRLINAYVKTQNERIGTGGILLQLPYVFVKDHSRNSFAGLT
jgi:hypothetical protein